MTRKELNTEELAELRVSPYCACTEKWRLYSVEEKRGKEGIEVMGILPLANGVAVHDFWKPYLNYDNVLHAMCCAHLERELVYIEESGKQDWAKALRELFQTMCHRRAVLTVEGADAFPKQELEGYLQQYDRLVEEGMKANPVPEKVPGKRGRTGKASSAVSLNASVISRMTSSALPGTGAYPLPIIPPNGLSAGLR